MSKIRASRISIEHQSTGLSQAVAVVGHLVVPQIDYQASAKTTQDAGRPPKYRQENCCLPFSDFNIIDTYWT